MKNKGMHQQPNAFTPSTGTSAPKNVNKSGFQPASVPHTHTQQSWNKPANTQPSQAVPAVQNKNFKGGKKAA